MTDFNNLIILSNTCVGMSVWSSIYNKEYNNPFMGTLIPNDLDFINLCNNIYHYIHCKPTLGEPRSNTRFSKQNSGVWYKNTAIKTPYPIIFLDDIEIHCIHENNNDECLDKFIRRLERTKSSISNNKYCKIFGILSFSELINDHENIQEIIDLYLSNINNIFAGPSKYKTTENNNYIIMKEFNNVALERNSSHIYNFNNQTLLSQIFSDHINKIYK